MLFPARLQHSGAHSPLFARIRSSQPRIRWVALFRRPGLASGWTCNCVVGGADGWRMVGGWRGERVSDGEMVCMFEFTIMCVQYLFVMTIIVRFLYRMQWYDYDWINELYIRHKNNIIRFYNFHIALVIVEKKYIFTTSDSPLAILHSPIAEVV